MKMTLQDLNFDNIYLWPQQIKILVIMVACLLTAAMGYGIDLSGQREMLKISQVREMALHQEIKNKQIIISQLPTLKEQLNLAKKSFTKIKKKFHTPNEIPALLDEVAKIGSGNGLIFSLLKPLPEKQQEFMVELPIQIAMTGNYHPFTKFMMQLAALDKITTANSFIVTLVGNNLQIELTIQAYLNS